MNRHISSITQQRSNADLAYLCEIVPRIDDLNGVLTGKRIRVHLHDLVGRIFLDEVIHL